MTTTDTPRKIDCPLCHEHTACAACGRCTNSACTGSPPRDPYCPLDGLSQYEIYLAGLEHGDRDCADLDCFICGGAAAPADDDEDDG